MTSICKKQYGTTVCKIKGLSLKPYSYDKGRKFCTHCKRTFLISARCCPCCGTPLRIHPRGRKGKEDLARRLNTTQPRIED